VVCVTGGDEEKRATVEAKNKKTGEHRFYEWWLSKYRNIFELGRCECDEDVGLWVKVYMGAE
jgi:hypothetical protein